MKYAHFGGCAFRLSAAAALCLLLSGCSGLPAAREMGDMALLRTMGVDRSPAGVAVTGSTGPRAKGVQGEDQSALTLFADRESLSGACLAMQGQSDSYVFFGYVDQLLVGEDLVQQGVLPVLDYFARDGELGLGAQIWLVRGATAREAVSAGGDQGVDSRLETIQNDSKMGIANLTCTAGEVYTGLLELGSAYIPALTPAEDGNAVLTELGYGVVRDGTLSGFLDGEAARGLELLAGGIVGDLLDVDLPNGQVSLRITSAHTQSSLEFHADSPSALTITCKVKARLAQYRDRPSGQAMEQLLAQVEERERERLNAALERMQTWGADCIGLGAKAAIGCPGKWQGVQADWPSHFSKIPINVAVQVQICG